MCTVVPPPMTRAPRRSDSQYSSLSSTYDVSLTNLPPATSETDEPEEDGLLDGQQDGRGDEGDESEEDQHMLTSTTV